MKKRLGIILPGKIGDIIICLPIAKYYHDMGCEIYWPIYSSIIDNFTQNIDYVNFLPLNMVNFNPIVDSENLLKNLKCEILDLAFTSPGSFDRKNSHNFVNQNELSFDQFRYKLANVPFENKWTLKFNRNHDREQDLYKKLVTQEYCLTHLDGSDERSNVKITNQKDHEIIEIKPISKSIFDWTYTIENAKVLVMFDSCFANLIEQINIPNRKFFIKRSEPIRTPILKNEWIII
jgi:hypothetical protein